MFSYISFPAKFVSVTDRNFRRRISYVPTNRGVRGAIGDSFEFARLGKNARHGPATTRRETALDASSIKSGAKPASGPETLRQEARYGLFRRRSAIGTPGETPSSLGVSTCSVRSSSLEAEQRIHDL